MRRLTAAMLGLVVVLSMAACGVVRATVDTDRALRDAGFPSARVTVDVSNGYTTVIVRGIGGGEQEGLRAAGVVWRAFPYRLDAVDAGGLRFTRQSLVSQFGPRPANYDRRTFSGDVLRSGRGVLAGVAVAGSVLFVGLVVLIVVLIRRTPRRPI